ncbi:MAG: hypothetical protein QXQ18_00385 [Candidatus Aenigmatarchaeota archaeon]
MIFGRKKKETSAPPVEENIKLPTIEEIMKLQNEQKTEPIKSEPQKQLEVKQQEVSGEEPSIEVKVPLKVETKVETKTQPLVHREKIEKEKHEKVLTAPLFVKLDRYKQILNHLAQLKTSIVLLKNSLAVLNELDKLREENSKLVQESLEKIEQKILDLDSELLRPSGFREELLPHMEEVASIEATLADLKSQIEQLRSGLGVVEE